jgi:dolichol-phosphate mannosyltransferase
MKMTTHKKSLISIVIPVYNEVAGLQTFHAFLTEVVNSLDDYRFELLYCNDGSTDGSHIALKEIAENSKNVRVISLTRNFGKEIATTAGLQHAKGEAVITIDADGQHPVSCIPEFLAHWRQGAKVVIGLRDSVYYGSYIRKMGSRGFYYIINKFSHSKMAPRSTDYRLIDREVQQLFVDMTEHNRITRGLIDWLGYKPTFITFQVNERIFGAATYSISRLFKLAVDSIIASSLAPLYLAAFLGAIILPVSVLLGIVMVVDALAGDPLGWRATGTAYGMVAILFLIGLLMISQGIVGLYLSHIHSETQNRPLYVINNEGSIRL